MPNPSNAKPIATLGRDMQAMVLDQVGQPLSLQRLPLPQIESAQVLVNVLACGVCRTDLHIADGDLDSPKLPLILGHQILGRITRCGPDVVGFQEGDTVGVPWLGETCQDCSYCKVQQENLCERALFTGYNRNGGFAEYTAVHHAYALRLPKSLIQPSAPPLLCAGLIGYRSLSKTGPAQKIGLYGFGSSAHIVCQIAKFQKRKVFAFTRPQDRSGQEFALRMGADWAGDSDQSPPEELDAAILFAPVGSLVPAALKAIRKGGRVVCAGIHMSDIPGFPYHLLWGEKQVTSVANLTRKDGQEFFRLTRQVPIKTEVTLFPLEEANLALEAIRSGKLNGSAVLQVN